MAVKGDRSNVDCTDAAEQPKKARFSLKTKFKMLLAVGILVAVVVGYWYVQRARVELQEARSVMETYTLIQQEQQRCSKVLQEQSGDFGEYEYCSRLLKNLPVQ